MSERIMIEFEQVQQTAAALERGAAGIRAVLERLDAELAVLDARWSGEAHDAFFAARANWERSMAAMQTALDSTAELLEGANEAMQRTEAAIAGAF